MAGRTPYRPFSRPAPTLTSMMTAVIGTNARPVARADLPWTDWKNKLKTKTNP